MQTSSPRFKSIAVSAGLTFWFFIITSTTGFFSLEIFLLFIGIIFSVTQIFTKKISKGLDVFAIINTKIFLGILFRLLRIDLLRLKKQDGTYWLDVEQTKLDRIRKQY